jgi:hypothetical protein
VRLLPVMRARAQLAVAGYIEVFAHAGGTDRAGTTRLVKLFAESTSAHLRGGVLLIALTFGNRSDWPGSVRAAGRVHRPAGRPHLPCHQP